MTNLSQRVLEWIETPGLDPACSIASDSQTATARGLFLGQDTSDPAARGSAIFTDSQNLPTAVATILNRCQERANFHPASDDPEELARNFPQYVAEIDRCLFFTLKETSVDKQSFNTKDYNILFDQITDLYDGMTKQDLEVIRQSLADLAKSVFSGKGEDASKNLFSQSTVDITDPKVPKIHLYYTSLRMSYKSGKAEVTKQEYQVTRATYIVLTTLIVANAPALTRLTTTSIDAWATSATTPEAEGRKLCFEQRGYIPSGSKEEGALVSSRVGRQNHATNGFSEVVSSPPTRSARVEWTEERMRNAIPLDLKKLDLPASSSRQTFDDPTWPVTYVPPSVAMYPFESMCKIYARRGGRDYQASGWIVEGNTGIKGIITAGHVVYDEGTWADDFYVLRGYTRGTWAESFTSQQCKTLTGWAANPGRDSRFWDIAAIVPETRISPQTPALVPCWGFDPAVPPFNMIFDPGYPCQPANGFDFDGESLWLSGGPARQLSSNGYGSLIEAFNDMEGGSSGSPWLVFNLADQRYYAAGIQVANGTRPRLSVSPQFDFRNIVPLLQSIGVLREY